MIVCFPRYLEMIAHRLYILYLAIFLLRTVTLRRCAISSWTLYVEYDPCRITMNFYRRIYILFLDKIRCRFFPTRITVTATDNAFAFPPTYLKYQWESCSLLSSSLSRRLKLKFIYSASDPPIWWRERTIISVTKLIKLAVQSRVTIHRECDSTRVRGARVSGELSGCSGIVLPREHHWLRKDHACSPATNAFHSGGKTYQALTSQKSRYSCQVNVVGDTVSSCDIFLSCIDRSRRSLLRILRDKVAARCYCNV